MTAPAAAGSSQAVQAAVATALAADLQRAWPNLNVTDLRGSLPGFAQIVAALVRKYGLAAATAAVIQYRLERASAGVISPLKVKPAPLPSLPQIGNTVSWATQPLWTASPDITKAQTRVQGAVEKLVLDVGRQTVIDNVQQDRHAIGWARVPEPGACYFCALLATRGAVYKDKSFARSDAQFASHADTASTIKTHDHCRCHAEPVFTAYEPTAQIREWQQLYTDAARGGRGSKNVQQRWRVAYQAAYPSTV